MLRLIFGSLFLSLLIIFGQVARVDSLFHHSEKFKQNQIWFHQLNSQQNNMKINFTTPLFEKIIRGLTTKYTYTSSYLRKNFPNQLTMQQSNWQQASLQLNGDLSISAHHAVLLDQESSRILYEKNAHEKTSIASLTKVMTAIIAIEYGDLDDIVKTSNRAIYTSGSSIYLQKKEKMTLEDLLYGLMLRSGNDASVAIAEHIGGSVEGFVFLMNEKAAYLGLTNTHFENPHGLEEKNHYSSAYDVAKLMQYAMENDTFKKITGTKAYHSKNRSYQWNNKNKLLHIYDQYCIGGKTGFTKKAGRTLVSTAKKDGLQLIAVTLNSPNDWNEHISLYNDGFEQYEPMKLLSKGKKEFLRSNGEKMEGMIAEDIIFPLQESELDKLNKRVVFYGKQDEKIGTLSFSIDQEPIIEVTFNAKNVDQKTFMEQLLQNVKRMFQVIQDD